MMLARSPARCFPWQRFAVLLLLVMAAGCGPVGENGEPLGSAEWPVHNVCGSGNEVQGIDVSKWQGAIDWGGVSQSGVVYAFVRASDGVTGIDAQFDANWKGAKANGIIRGVYQYFEPASDATEQAKVLVDMVNAAGGFEQGDLPAVIDVETMGGQSASVVMAKVHTWIDYVQAATQRRPIVYTGSYFWDDNGLDDTVSSYPLWTAHYTSNPCPLTSSAWTKWTFWQYTDSGSVTGISGGVDSDVFDGTPDDLQQFIADSYLGTVQPDAGEPDAVVQEDAAEPDAPVVEPDAAEAAPPADAGADVAPEDAALDADEPGSDAELSRALHGDVADESPCGCRTAGQGRGPSRGTGVLAVLAIAAALCRFRRRLPAPARGSVFEAHSSFDRRSCVSTPPRDATHDFL